jgi:xanthine dehydrogenase accessory factor
VTVDHDGRAVEIFVDSVTAPPEVVVFGGGHDVPPVVEQATRVGFRVTVVTFRGGNADPSRFPAAAQVRSTAPSSIRADLSFDGDTYAVVMSHNFVDDRLVLTELLDTPVPYIGLLGPRERFEEIRTAVDEPISPADLDRIYAPVGLDLGGGTPQHIAQSIVAEITAVHHGREPTHLAERAGPIHPRPAAADSDGRE